MDTYLVDIAHILLILFVVSDRRNWPAENVRRLERSFIRRLTASYSYRGMRLCAMLIWAVVELLALHIDAVFVPCSGIVAFGE